MKRHTASPSTTIGTLTIGGTEPPRVMAIINASPESFYQNSVAAGKQAVRDAAERAAEEGADILDIGAISTAPYKETFVTPEIEAERMMEAIRAAREATGLPITTDTQRASVARVALDSGADAINDVSGLRDDPEMAKLAAERGCAVILMANESAVEKRDEQHPIELVSELIRKAIARADAAGITGDKIIIDPGIGFFRRQSMSWYEFDLGILRELHQLKSFERPILVSASRKSFLGKMIGKSEPADRGSASLAVALWCAQSGASIIRTHDPGAIRDALIAWRAIAEFGS